MEKTRKASIFKIFDDKSIKVYGFIYPKINVRINGQIYIKWQRLESMFYSSPSYETQV